MQTLMDLLCSWVGALPFECLEMRFMQEAFLGVLICAPLAASAGVFVVNFRMSFFSDAIGHSAFAGAALGMLCALGPARVMPLLAVGIALLMMYLKRRSTLSSDTVIGVLFSAVVALGLALASRNPDMGREMQGFLYGDILTISGKEIFTLFLLAVIYYAFILFSFNRLISAGINELLAQTHRIRVALYEYIHIALLALVVIFCVKAVGVLLVTALLIVPAAAARNFSRNAGQMFHYSIWIGLVSGISGLLLSSQDWAQTASGASIVLVACVFFLLSMIYASFRRKK